MLLCVSAVAVSAQDAGALRFRGFSGGMTIHSGYLSAGRINIVSADGLSSYSHDVNGAPLGLGGSMRVHFGNHLRVGGEGYGTTLKYGGNGSFLRVSWGGVLVDGIWRTGRFSPFAGVTFGGGSLKNVTLFERAKTDMKAEEQASYRRYGFMAAVPFAGVEFHATEKIALVLKTDWMFNVTNPQPDFPSGPRIYFGISFYRLKN